MNESRRELIGRLAVVVEGFLIGGALLVGRRQPEVAIPTLFFAAVWLYCHWPSVRKVFA